MHGFRTSVVGAHVAGTLVNFPEGQNWKLQVSLDRCDVGSLQPGRSDVVDERSFVFGGPQVYRMRTMRDMQPER